MKKITLNRYILKKQLLFFFFLVSIITSVLLASLRPFIRKSAEIKTLEGQSSVVLNFFSNVTAQISLPTVETFKTSYSKMLENYSRGLKDIQLFGGGLVLSEFDDGSGKIYAGHLGNFWAPPIFSDYGTDKTKWENGGFNFGLVFQNNNRHFTEQPSDPKTEAFWYPSKMVVNKQYTETQGAIEVKGVRVALPGKRGFGLKLTLTNKSPIPQSYKVLFIGHLPTIDTTKAGQWGGLWNWKTLSFASSPKKTNAYLQDGSLNQTIIIADNDNREKSYTAVSLSEKPVSWALDNQKKPIYEQFIKEEKGLLENVDHDDDLLGSAYGLVGDFTNLNYNQSKTITLVMGFGETSSEALKIASDFQTKDIEAEADNYWNNRLRQVFSSIPTFQSKDEALNRIYLNSVLTYLVNRWETFNSVGETAGYGQSLSFFPWLTGTAGFFPYAEPNFWKGQLKKVLGFPSEACKAYDFVTYQHMCDYFYAYNQVSLIDAVYKYIVTTEDFNFLNEEIEIQRRQNNGEIVSEGKKTIAERLKDLLKIDENREIGQNSLADFGNDWNLYEYSRHSQPPMVSFDCGISGKYVGQVVSPNAERIVAYRQVAELLGKKGENVASYLQKAEKININSLWNSQTKWFNSNGTTFFNIVPYFLLQYDNLLSNNQMVGIMEHFDGFKGLGEFGLTSLHSSLRKSDKTWCSNQADWQGPGLYSGALGAVLTGLYKNGYQNLAYDVFTPRNGKGYTYLKDVPYLSQAFYADKKGLWGGTAYLEGVSLAQSIIEGMFGVSPSVDLVSFKPHIPDRLRQSGQVALTRLNIKGNVWNLGVDQENNHYLSLVLNQRNNIVGNPLSFKYEANGTVNFRVENLEGEKNYQLLISSLGNENFQAAPQTIKGRTNQNGALNLSFNLDGLRLLTLIEADEEIQPTLIPTMTPTPALRKCDTSDIARGYDFAMCSADGTSSPDYYCGQVSDPERRGICYYNIHVVSTGVDCPSDKPYCRYYNRRSCADSTGYCNLNICTRNGCFLPTVIPTAIPTSVPPSLSCTGGCYGSSSNCQKNCGRSCTVIKGITVENMCGWPSYYQAYRCCTGVTQVTPTPTLVPGLTSVPTPTPTIAGGLSCSGGCYGSSSNCQKNCGRACIVLDDLNMQQMCGWPSGYKAYRCCR